MSDSRSSRGSWHHRTSGNQSVGKNGQQAGCQARSDGFTRRGRHPLRGSADALARVDPGRSFLPHDRALPTDMGATDSCSDHDAGARLGDLAQCRSRCAMGSFTNLRSAIRPPLRRTGTRSSRRPVRSAAPNLCRDGSRLGGVPRPPRRADTSVRKRGRAPRRMCRRRFGVDGRGGIGSPAWSSRVSRCRNRSPRSAGRACR